MSNRLPASVRGCSPGGVLLLWVNLNTNQMTSPRAAKPPTTWTQPAAAAGKSAHCSGSFSIVIPKSMAQRVLFRSRGRPACGWDGDGRAARRHGAASRVGRFAFLGAAGHVPFGQRRLGRARRPVGGRQVAAAGVRLAFLDDMQEQLLER